MNQNNQEQCLEQMHYFIQNTVTGTTKEFADKLDVSVDELCELFKEAREMGARIDFSSTLMSYYYKTPATIHSLLSFRLIPG